MRHNSWKHINECSPGCNDMDEGQAAYRAEKCKLRKISVIQHTRVPHSFVWLCGCGWAEHFSMLHKPSGQNACVKQKMFDIRRTFSPFVDLRTKKNWQKARQMLHNFSKWNYDTLFRGNGPVTSSHGLMCAFCDPTVIRMNCFLLSGSKHIA